MVIVQALVIAIVKGEARPAAAAHAPEHRLHLVLHLVLHAHLRAGAFNKPVYGPFIGLCRQVFSVTLVGCLRPCCNLP